MKLHLVHSSSIDVGMMSLKHRVCNTSIEYSGFVLDSCKLVGVFLILLSGHFFLLAIHLCISFLRNIFLYIVQSFKV